MKTCKTCNKTLKDTKQPGYEAGYGGACYQKILDRCKAMGECAYLRGYKESDLRSKINERGEFTETQKSQCLKFFKNAINLSKNALYQSCMTWKELSHPRKMFNKKMKVEAHSEKIIKEGETRYDKKILEIERVTKEKMVKLTLKLSDSMLIKGNTKERNKIKKELVALENQETNKDVLILQERAKNLSYLTKIDVAVDFESLLIGLSSIEKIGVARGYLKPSLSERKHYARKLAEAINLVFETDSERFWVDKSIMPMVRRVGLKNPEFRNWLKYDIRQYILAILFKDDDKNEGGL